METWQELLIYAAALIVLIGICWLIFSDARKHAPKDSHTHAELQATGNELSPRERERKRKANRSRTKAQRRARRANRPH